MPITLQTILSKIDTCIPNKGNSDIIRQFYQYLKDRDTSENYQKGMIKAIVHFAGYLDPDTSFYDITRPEQIVAFLNTKIKPVEIDPDKKWITTWNDYLWRIKLFFRWLCSNKNRNIGVTEGNSIASEGADYNDDLDQRDSRLSADNDDDWKTPEFARIKKKKTKRISPYSETEIWDRDELLSIIKYEPYARNRAALTLFWDLDARNHEVTMLKIKNIRMRERWAEGEVPFEAKTGSGPILLTASYPFVRDWLNEHPFRNSPEARVICNLYNGGAVKPEAMWSMMKQLRKRIERLIESGEISDPSERERLKVLLQTKKWNPYALRHSAITYDADSLAEFALRKKVRWSMNSKQPTRYIKNRMGNNLKRKILIREGIIVSGNDALERQKPVVLPCPRCNLLNAYDNKQCSGCGYPLNQTSFDQLRNAEEERIRRLELQNQENSEMLKTILGVLAKQDDEVRKHVAIDLISRGSHLAGE